MKTMRYKIIRGIIVLIAIRYLYVIFGSLACKSDYSTPPMQVSAALDSSTVVTIITRAVETAVRMNETVNVAVTDREGNILGVFNMDQPPLVPENPLLGCIAKARTASYLSSNQHAFTTLTGCWITRPHYPPGVSNAPGGPLYGVTYSAIGGGDINRNDGTAGVLPAQGQQGLTGAPGGVPIYINGVLVGGLGISFASDEGALDVNSPLSRCAGTIINETIAFAALQGYTASPGIQANQILLDGISLAYSNLTNIPAINFTFTPAMILQYGTWDIRFPVRDAPPQRLPDNGYIQGYSPSSGIYLSADEVNAIVMRCVDRSNRTRAAIRQPAGTSARVTISVADVDGRILAIYRMADATIFGYDVAPQKARTAVAFNSNHSLAQQLRNTIGITQPMAVTTRTIGFLAQDYFPPGIDRDSLGIGTQPGPMWQGREFAWQASLGVQPFGNGITIFPGGMPLYRNGVLVGGIGISGDGVDQDDYIAAAGAQGYEAPMSMQADQFSYLGVRLPYLKFPRNPELP